MNVGSREGEIVAGSRRRARFSEVNYAHLRITADIGVEINFIVPLL
jgi:hypothetical protein